MKQFEGAITGASFAPGKPEPGMKVICRREDGNPVDPHAVEVVNAKGVRVGYLPMNNRTLKGKVRAGNVLIGTVRVCRNCTWLVDWKLYSKSESMRLRRRSIQP